MGNDLNLVFQGKVIASLGRKHLYTFCGGYDVLTKDQIIESLNLQRRYLIETMVAYSAYLLTKDGEDVTDELDYLIEKVEVRIDTFEEMVMVAGRMFVLNQLIDEFNEEDLEILDDYEYEKKYLFENEDLANGVPSLD